MHFIYKTITHKSLGRINSTGGARPLAATAVQATAGERVLRLEQGEPTGRQRPSKAQQTSSADCGKQKQTP